MIPRIAKLGKPSAAAIQIPAKQQAEEKAFELGVNEFGDDDLDLASLIVSTNSLRDSSEIAQMSKSAIARAKVVAGQADAKATHNQRILNFRSDIAPVIASTSDTQNKKRRLRKRYLY